MSSKMMDVLHEGLQRNNWDLKICWSRSLTSWRSMQPERAEICTHFNSLAPKIENELQFVLEPEYIAGLAIVAGVETVWLVGTIKSPLACFHSVSNELEPISFQLEAIMNPEGHCMHQHLIKDFVVYLKSTGSIVRFVVPLKDLQTNGTEGKCRYLPVHSYQLCSESLIAQRCVGVLHSRFFRLHKR